MLDEKTKELIRKYAVKNANDYGKAIPGSIIGKIMSLPKMEIGEVKSEVQKAVLWVNALSRFELEANYSKYSDEFKEEQKIKAETTSKPKMELPGAIKGNFATRFPPAPNGYMHIGHAKASILEQEFAKIYDGKLFLYWDDTNPEKDREEYVEAIKNDLKWLGIKFDKEYYASDSIEKLYTYAKKLINDGKAYACSCTAEQMKDKRMHCKKCEHRTTSKEESLKVFEEMLDGTLDEGDAVIRLKANIESQNTTLRDPTLLRIKKEPHYRHKEKYKVWPLYDFNTPILDSMNGVTDVIRSKEYELRDELYYMILDMLGLRKPRIHSEARLTIKNNITSKREQNLYVKEGKLSGYDDPRLVTIIALKRRGVEPDAIRNFVLRFGMSKAESVVDISMLLDENKKIIDPVAKRLYYVENPVKLVIEGAKNREITLNFHPSADMGTRSYEVSDTFYISGTDASKLATKDVLHMKNFDTVAVKKKQRAEILTTISNKDSDLNVQWVAEGKLAVAKIIIPKPPLNDDGTFNDQSLKTSEGYVESYAAKLKAGDIIQFERFGFCKLESKKDLQFIFISK